MSDEQPFPLRVTACSHMRTNGRTGGCQDCGAGYGIVMDAWRTRFIVEISRLREDEVEARKIATRLADGVRATLRKVHHFDCCIQETEDDADPNDCDCGMRELTENLIEALRLFDAANKETAR